MTSKHYMEEINNHGSKWTNEERNKLLIAVKEGKKIVEISNDHKRTIGGIRGQLKRIAIELNSEKKSIEEICVLTGLNRRDVEQYIKSSRKRSKRKSEVNEELKEPTVTELIKDMNKLFQQIIKKQEQLEQILDDWKDNDKLDSEIKISSDTDDDQCYSKPITKLDLTVNNYETLVSPSSDDFNSLHSLEPTEQIKNNDDHTLTIPKKIKKIIVRKIYKKKTMTEQTH
ncbi:MAG: hypothetical protein Harvfovirus57_7 [Harvfovirus sp.]|uniref:Uncharacterized protein n=1 Tax=Harvfovirus sp. TaxID=2487768 RepID=A0A3G5A3D2_9VIRU|nr:MAG: hypothetical protein Harvfovirus57_7 [Harvfovirus sp.]